MWKKTDRWSAHAVVHRHKQPVNDMQGSVQKEVKDKAKNFFTQALEMIKHPSTGFVEAVSDKDSKTD